MSDRLEGIHYVTDQSKRTATGKPRRRKPTTAELMRTLEVSDENIAASTEIRERANLEPLEPNFYRQALEAAVATVKVKPTRKPRKAAKAKPAPAPTVDTGRIAAALYATEADWRTCEAIADALELAEGADGRRPFMVAAYGGPAATARLEAQNGGARHAAELVG